MIVLEPSLVLSARVAALFEPAVAEASAPEYFCAAGGADSCVLRAERRHLAASGGPVKRPLIYRLLRLYGGSTPFAAAGAGRHLARRVYGKVMGPYGPSTIRWEEVNMSDDETLDGDEYFEIEDLVRRQLAPGELVDETTVISYLRFAAAAIEKQHQSG